MLVNEKSIMMLQFEKTLPAQFIEFHSSIQEEDSPNFQLIWPAVTSDQEVTHVSIVAPHVRIRLEDFSCQHYCIRFQSAFLEAACGIMPRTNVLRILASSNAQNTLSLLFSLVNQFNKQWHVSISCAITSLLGELLDQLPEKQKTEPALPKKSQSDGLKSARAILYATRYMKKHMSNPQLSLQNIANAIGYNSNYFCQEFSKIFSVSPIRFLNHLRVHRTLQLLEQSELSVNTICSLVGFTNPSRLSSMVKAASGMTPLKFRRSKKMQSI
ncbi:AraC family transcriptional regulator [Paenibacillus sp. N3.4]|uniref:helix-turn-helix domain-containing protein n=1 Tax=Paenibacillus sp. N3.4 TaxID=2603222 RepID=UPI0011C94DCE|nr:AraC family transcriptional regulator [Paenibacillus sp. N3.4]TXK84588.1 helix-turn-helix transcriptional regulator [Paenibacillus sp. N3.4]